MQQRRHHYRFAVWLAFLGVSLYALWPLLATMQPRGAGTHYELCPHASLHQMAGQSGHEAPSSNPIWNDHQLQCVFSLGVGDGATAVPTAAIVLIIDAASAGAITSPPGPVLRSTSRSYSTAPRGPPVLS